MTTEEEASTEEIVSLAGLVDELYSKEPQQTLFHYTSLAGLKGIFGSRSLWATDIRYLNDAAELRCTGKLLSTLIEQRIAEARSDSRLLEQLRRWLADRLVSEQGYMVFVTCFSEHGNLLSQWRGYCPVDPGVSLGFAPEKICEEAVRQSFRIGKCIYDRAEQQRLVAAALDSIERLAASQGENTDRSARHPSQSFHRVFETIEADLLHLAALVKDSSFAEEREWRAVSAVMSNYVKAPIEFRVGMSMLIPFLHFALPRNTKSGIDLKTVFMGPTPNVNESMSSLSRFFSKNGSHPRVKNCQIPYRT